MAVKIRLMRVGKKKQPTYRVVVADSRSPRDGRFIEIIGQYAPRQEPSRIELDNDRALAWLQQGAQPTEQVAKIFDAQGVWDAYESATGKPAAAKPKPKTPRPKAEKPAKAAAATESAPEASEASDAGDAGDAAEAPAAEEPAAEEPAADAAAEETSE